MAARRLHAALLNEQGFPARVMNVARMFTARIVKEDNW